MLHKVFVYGSLKSGCFNHSILEGFDFKPAKVKHIVLHSGIAYPFARRGVGSTYGEVYEVDDNTLAMLDNLEGHTIFYKRELVDAEIDSEKVKVWIYLCERQAVRYPIIESGVWNGGLINFDN